MTLLPPDRFADVFLPLQGKRIGFVRPSGNVGDALIEWATHQLFEHYEIKWTLKDPAGPVDDVDELVFGGGGNMGTLWEKNWHLRAQCLQTGLPLTILPQSFTSREDRPFRRVYVRERASWAFHPRGILAPDLALGLCVPSPAVPDKGTGLFLRRDCEGTVPRGWFSRDPVKMCRTPAEYLALAARYARIVTDRLHFAICGLLLGRHTTLLPNSYHKNFSMYETWLKDLGCEFAASPHEALRRRAA
jgi:exopolysaccharide biosynthesis predicted pyruvyltransferase EpsI